MRRRNWTVPYALFLIIFVVMPLLLIVVYAFTDAEGAFTFANFRKFMMHPESINTFVYSIGIAVITTLVCLLLGYPAAYILSQKRFNTSQTMVVLFILPMWVNILIRTLATVALFDFLNLPLGEGALVFGMVYNYLPFMILPLHTTLSSIDKSYIEAAQDLGADNTTVFLKTILPLSVSGIISGITMVFIPTISTFAISQLLSNGKIFLFGDSIQMKFDQGLYGVGSIMSLVMLVFVLISNFIMNRVGRNGNNMGRSLW